MCSFRDLDSAAAAAAARIDSCKFEVEVTEVGVPGVGVLGGDETTLEIAEIERREVSSLDGELSPSVQVLAGLCKTIIFQRECPGFAITQNLGGQRAVCLSLSRKQKICTTVHQLRFGADSYRLGKSHLQ